MWGSAYAVHQAPPLRPRSSSGDKSDGHPVNPPSSSYQSYYCGNFFKRIDWSVEVNQLPYVLIVNVIVKLTMQYWSASWWSADVPKIKTQSVLPQCPWPDHFHTALSCNKLSCFIKGVEGVCKHYSSSICAKIVKAEDVCKHFSSSTCAKIVKVGLAAWWPFLCKKRWQHCGAPSKTAAEKGVRDTCAKKYFLFRSRSYFLLKMARLHFHHCRNNSACLTRALLLFY